MVKLCGAHGRQKGEPCRRPSRAANGRCYLHGGRNHAGPAHHAFKDGRYSKYMPFNLGERYREALADPDLLSLKDEIALVDTQLANAVEKLGADESAVNWHRLRLAWSSYKQAQASEDWLVAAAAFEQFEALMAQGEATETQWHGIARLINQRRSLVESERKRHVELRDTMTVTEAMVLLAAITDIVRRNVTDHSVLARISGEVARLVDSEPRRAALPAGA